MEKSQKKQKKALTEGVAMTFNLTHAKHDTVHCLAPGLFRSLKKGDRKKLKLDVTYVYSEKETLRFIGFEPLDDFDLRLLQGIVATAGDSKLTIDLSDPREGNPKQLSVLLNPEFEAADKISNVARTTIYEITKEIGLADDGPTVKNIKDSLIRMSNVTVLINQDKKQWSSNLMSHSFDKNTGKLLIALNPRISEALLGDRPHTRISMNEVRAIKSSPTRLIHQRFCGYIRPGDTHPTPINIDTIASYAWPDETEEAEAMKKRRQTIRKSLSELKEIGWTIEEIVRGKFSISRPSVF